MGITDLSGLDSYWPIEHIFPQFTHVLAENRLLSDHHDIKPEYNCKVTCGIPLSNLQILQIVSPLCG